MTYHRFFLVPIGIPVQDISRANLPVVRLHDYLITAMWGYLNWIPSLDPETGSAGWGLNRWGTTVIQSEGAERMRVIFHAWSEIFSCAPPLVDLDELAYGVVFDREKDPVICQKEKIMEDVMIIAGYAQAVEDGGYYIAHGGI